jgi:hypothetical protein
MKNIKLFENFNSREKFAEIVDDVFSTIQDDPKWGEDCISIDDVEEYLNGQTDYITIWVGISENIDPKSFNSYFRKLQLKHELFSKVKSCLELLQKYMTNDLGVTDFFDDDDSISISIYEIESSGDFWTKSENGVIKFDYESILELTGAPKDTKLSISSNGREKFFEFKFRNIEDYDEYKDEFNNKIKNLKIEDESIVEPFYPYYPGGPQANLVDFTSDHDDHTREKSLTFKINSKINFEW